VNKSKTINPYVMVHGHVLVKMNELDIVACFV